MATRYGSSQASTEDVLAIVDRYLMGRLNNLDTSLGDLRPEAELISVLAGVLGRNKRMIVIADQEDHRAIAAYEAEAYEVRSMNGDRPFSLPRLVHDELGKLSARHLVIVSDDPVFAPLCNLAVQCDTHVSIWSITGNVPEELRDPRFDHRNLQEMLPRSYLRQSTTSVWLDVENLLIGALKRGWKPDIEAFVEAIRTESTDVGEITQITAYGDFGLLRERLGSDVQRTLEKLGVRTRYQVNVRGKNSADMEIARDVHTAIERDEMMGTVVIGTGDRDFRPTIDLARKRGKKVVLLAIKDDLSNQLRMVVQDVRYLDEYFRPSSSAVSYSIDPHNPWVPLLMRVAGLLSRHHWQWGYCDRLTEILEPDQLQGMIREGVLRKPGHPNHANTVAFNFEHPLVKAVLHMASWIPERVDHVINEKRLPYVDTNYLARGMQMDRTCQELSIGQERSEAEAWLVAAAAAGLVGCQPRPHPKTPEHIIDTWLPLH
jgi:uncharacterized LabA/DUF88 family protein